MPQMTVTSLEVMNSHNQVQIDLKDMDLNRLMCGLWKRAQRVKILSEPHKHRDLSSDPRRLVKARHLKSLHSCDEMGGGWENLEAHSQLCWTQNNKETLSQTRWKAWTNTQGCPLIHTMGEHPHLHSYRIHTYTHTYTHAHAHTHTEHALEIVTSWWSGQKQCESYRDSLLPGQQELNLELTQLFEKHFLFVFLKKIKLIQLKVVFFYIFQCENL